LKVITDERCTGYSHPGHPERPERILSALELLHRQDELPLTWAQPGPGDDTPLLRAHSPEHLARLEAPEDFDDDTPFLPGIARYARDSVGAALSCMRATRAGEMAFSLMRPPGHHALRSRAMGFCYLNNVAVAVLEALASGCRRVAVFDFDVHHCNGTEALLLNHPGTVVYSIHQFPCYPGTGTRNVGNNCYNFPLPPLTSRGDCRQAVQSALRHLGGFKPELIAVSAGFDAYARDPLGQLTLELEDFHWIGRQLRALATPVFSVLEGGYSPDLPALILAYLKGLEGR
jgi:acetoin utilization deacetylase AcuC-like enzyme